MLVYSHPTHLRHAKNVVDKGCLRASGVIEGSGGPRVSFDMREVIEFSKIIILTVPSTGQEMVLQELRTFDLRQHTVIAIPGNLFSVIAEAEMEMEHVLEANLSPYSYRMSGRELAVLGKKSLFSIAALQQDLSLALNQKIRSIFPMDLKWGINVLKVCLSNTNSVFHPLIMPINAARIESTAADFLLYRNTLTHSVANAILALDKLRMKIGSALGVEVSNDVRPRFHQPRGFGLNLRTT